MQPVHDYFQSKPRELKKVDHREWQAADTKNLLQNQFAHRAEESRARRPPRRQSSSPAAAAAAPCAAMPTAYSGQAARSKLAAAFALPACSIGLQRARATVRRVPRSAAQRSAARQPRGRHGTGRRSQVFDSRRERMEQERRNLIIHHSLPDWRTAIFENNRRRVLDGAEALNKARSLRAAAAPSPLPRSAPGAVRSQSPGGHVLAQPSRAHAEPLRRPAQPRLCSGHRGQLFPAAACATLRKGGPRVLATPDALPEVLSAACDLCARGMALDAGLRIAHAQGYLYEVRPGTAPAFGGER